MVAILFLIGQGLESPSLIDELLDIRKTPAKPRYEMADDAPLVLWDCIFPGIDTKPVDTTSKSVDGYEKGDHIPQEEQQRGYDDAPPVDNGTKPSCISKPIKSSKILKQRAQAPKKRLTLHSLAPLSKIENRMHAFRTTPQFRHNF